MQEMVEIPLNHAASYQVNMITYLKAYSQGKVKKGAETFSSLTVLMFARVSLLCRSDLPIATFLRFAVKTRQLNGSEKRGRDI